jgi:hypothetical protein
MTETAGSDLSRIESVDVCVARVPLDRVTSFATRTVVTTA